MYTACGVRQLTAPDLFYEIRLILELVRISVDSCGRWKREGLHCIKKVVFAKSLWESSTSVRLHTRESNTLSCELMISI